METQFVNHYPRHIGDWMVATAHLPPIEECMYSRLCDQYYVRELPLPTEVSVCCRLVRATSATERRAVDSVLREFFVSKEDGWHQKRCDEELASFRAKSAKASESAGLRWSRQNANGHANAMRTHMPTQCEGNANQNQEPEPRKTKTAREPRPTRLPDGFGISERVTEWAASKGHSRLEERLEDFVSYAKRSGKKYLDWDEALMTAIRDDWAEFGATGSQKKVI